VHLQDLDKTVFLPQAGIELSEFVGLLSGVATFAHELHNLAPSPGLLLVEGDNKFIIKDLQEVFEHRNGGKLCLEDQLAQLVFDEVVAILRDVEEDGVNIFFRYRPRRFNKVADQLTRKARRLQQGNFTDPLLNKLSGNLQEASTQPKLRPSRATEWVAARVAVATGAPSNGPSGCGSQGSVTSRAVPQPSSGGEWEPYWSEEKGSYYYYNSKLNESRWLRPTE